MTEPSGRTPSEAGESDAARESHRDPAPELYEEPWITPPFQPLRAIAALVLTAIGLGLYEYVLVSFWSVHWLGIHSSVPWPAYAVLATALMFAMAAVRVALSLRSPHGKLGFALLAFLACIAIGVGGGRFVSYTMRGTLNPPFTLNLAIGERFPAFALADQSGNIRSASPDYAASLIFIYRGDYCPFARFELADLTAHADKFRSLGVQVLGISADPVERSKMLSGFLHTEIPLLGDVSESILGPLGLVQRHRNGEPDNAIPAYIILDRGGVVRWIFAPRYYRQLPTVDALLEAAKSVVSATQPPAPIASPS